VNHGRKYHRKLAVQAGIVAQIGWDRIEEFWAMLTQGLKERHQTAPVHSLQEINVLHERFPQEILLCTASADGEALAGTLLYCAGPVVHTQYTAASNAGRLTSALDPVIEYSVEYASTHGYTYFDFGISNDGHGRALNASLQDFKVSFGAGGVVYVQVSLPLD
jgi:lipid II:glycine glycyltransferase (peptidoglycan interpeptide bridge formation enzyme)